MKSYLLAAALGALAGAGFAAPEKYTLDASHSQVVFSYDHAGFSTTQGMFSGFEGEIMFDAEDPAASSVAVSMRADSLFTGWAARDEQFLRSGDFFRPDAFPDVTFTSTNIEVTGERTALITGDLSLNGVMRAVVLDATLNQITEAYPFPPFSGKPAIGVSATTSLRRSDFDLGMFAPFIGDRVDLEISIEAMKLD